MRTVLTVFGAIGFVLSVLIFMSAQSAIHEIEALIVVLTSTVAISAGGVIAAIERLPGVSIGALAVAESGVAAPPAVRAPMTPQQRKRMYVVMGIVGVLVAGAAAFAVWESSAADRAQAERRHELHLEQLRSGPFTDAALANLAAGDYKGRVVRVPARFTRVDGGDVLVDGAVCRYIGDASLIAKLTAGQRIVIHAEAAGVSAGVVQLNDCVIEPP